MSFRIGSEKPIPQWETEGGDTFVFKNVPFQNGRFYDVRLRRPGAPIRPDFAIAKEDLEEIQSICAGIFSQIRPPEAYGIVRSFEHDVCQAMPLRGGAIIDLKEDRGVQKGFADLNRIFSPFFRMISSPHPILMIPASRHVGRPDLRETAPAAESLGPEAPTDGPIQQPRPIFSDEEESDEEDSAPAQPAASHPSERDPVSTAVPSAPLLEQKLYEEAQKLSLEGTLNSTPDCSIKFSELKGQKESPKAEYRAFQGLLKNPNARGDAEQRMKELLLRWLHELYERHFINQRDEKARAAMSATWVLTLLAKSGDNIQPLREELCSCYLRPPLEAAASPQEEKGMLRRILDYVPFV